MALIGVFPKVIVLIVVVIIGGFLAIVFLNKDLEKVATQEQAEALLAQDCPTDDELEVVENFAIENDLHDLLDRVEAQRGVGCTPLQNQTSGKSQEPASCDDEYARGTAIPYDELFCIAGQPGCEVWLDFEDLGLYCLSSKEELDGYYNSEGGLNTLTNNKPPTYPYIGNF